MDGTWNVHRDHIQMGTPIHLCDFFGGTGNRIVELEHAINLAKLAESVLYVDEQWDLFINEHFDGKRLSYRVNTRKCSEILHGYLLSGFKAYFMFYPRIAQYTSVLPKVSARKRAENFIEVFQNL